MPPKPAPTTNSIDGLSRPPASLPIKPTPLVPDVAAKAEKKPAVDRNKVTVPKAQQGPVVAIVITIVMMILLIGLTYFVYNKSK